MRRFPLILVLLTLATLPSYAGNFHLPEIPDGEVRYYKSYYARREDKPDLAIVGSNLMHSESSKAFSEWAQWQGEGNSRRLVITRDALSYNDTRSINKFTLKVGDDFAFLKFDRKWTTLDGTVTQEWFFDFSDPSLGYPKNIYHHMLLPWLARSMDFESGQPAHFYVWLDTTYVYPMIMTVEGEERIKVEAGEFDCWRVVARLDKSKLDDIVSKILGRAMPKYTYWMDKGGSHGLVRLQWPIFTGVYGDEEHYQTQELVKTGRRGE